MKLSSRVLDAIDCVRQHQTLNDLGNRAALVTNLVFMYQVIKASERLLVEAANESTGRLKDYYEIHLEEEREHEKWLAEDLATAGIDVNAVAPIRLAVELAGTQYYLIKHHNPASLLGYMAVLEAFPFDVALLEKLEKLHGKELLRCLRYHAINDQYHRVELLQVIDEVDDEEVLRNAVNTQMYLNRFAEELKKMMETK